MIELYEHAKMEYRRLLKIPHGELRRVYADSYLAFLRDFIALMENRSSEDIQNQYEAQARQ